VVLLRSCRRISFLFAIVMNRSSKKAPRLLLLLFTLWRLPRAQEIGPAGLTASPGAGLVLSPAQKFQSPRGASGRVVVTSKVVSLSLQSDPWLGGEKQEV
jgi:hypothetical protein